MIRFASGVTMTCAATDLIVGLVLIPLTLALKKIKAADEDEKKLWIKLMSVLSAVCLTGFIVHGIIWGKTAYGVIWVGLYAIMFIAVRNFLFVAVHKRYGENGISNNLSRLIDIVSVGLYILMSVLCLIGINPIRIFTVYGILLIIPGFFLFAMLAKEKGDRCSKLILSALLPQLVGGAFILCRTDVFRFIVPMDHNCIYHLCLLFSVVIFYYAARRSLEGEYSEEREETEEACV